LAYFDRFDICEAYCVLEWDWNKDGWLHERPSNRRRMEATSIQLARIQFRPGMGLSYDSLTENGKEIYSLLCKRYGFEWCPSCGANLKSQFCECVKEA